MDFRRHFDGMHYAVDLGFRKHHREFYTAIERRIGFTPRQICLIDDRAENVASATSAGWSAFHWNPSSRLDEVLTGFKSDPDGGSAT